MDNIPWCSKRLKPPLKIVAMAGDTENEHGVCQTALRKPDFGGYSKKHGNGGYWRDNADVGF